jgi:serine/threonine protein kinase
MNHKSNRHIVPLILARMSDIKPYPAGQRLLKLLCTDLNDTSLYKGWKKMANGAYGTIYDCHTDLNYPQEVAVKVTTFKESIYDRCVLHDIFSEITCLEYFRLQPNITTLYDYGIHKGQYYIVMKKYSGSLKKWREMQTLPLEKNLGLYLKIFLKILTAITCLHNNNITHYDLKCDNVLIDAPEVITEFMDPNQVNFNIAIADFGECKIYLNEDEELDLQNRGTEYIKSPEMLNLTLNSKKDHENFDRRRTYGTSKASDIWSIGCLFYELLTGKFLFYDPDWIRFYSRVTSKDQELVNESNRRELGNDPMLIDFLTSVLVRSSMHRPSIDHVMCKFQQLFTLKTGLDQNKIMQICDPVREDEKSKTVNSKVLGKEIESLVQELQQRISDGEPISKLQIDQGPKAAYTPSYIQVLEQVALCSKDFFLNSQEKIYFKGYTHVFTVEGLLRPSQLQRYQYLLLNPSVITKSTDVIKLVPKVFDFIREVYVFKGKLLFVEDTSVKDKLYTNSVVLREAILYSLASLFKCSVYDMWMLINNQTLFFTVPIRSIKTLSSAIFYSQQIISLCQRFPNLQCFCGCNTLVIMEEAYLKRPSKECQCSRVHQTALVSDCPSDGCQEYLKFIKKRYEIPWEKMKWGYFKPSDFILGPLYVGQVSNKFHMRHLLCSEGPVENSVPYVKKIPQDSQYYKNSQEEYKLFACKVCHMWVYGIEAAENKIVVPTNILVTKRNKNGLLQFKSGPKVSIKAPMMRKINLDDIYN